MYDYLAKTVLLGPSGAGKSVAHDPILRISANRRPRSCLLHRFVKSECMSPLHVPNRNLAS